MRRPTPEIPRRRLLHGGKKRTNPEADQSGGRLLGARPPANTLMRAPRFAKSKSAEMQRLALIAALPVGATIAGTPTLAEYHVDPVKSGTQRYKVANRISGSLRWIPRRRPPVRRPPPHETQLSICRPPR
jgi:hypothetical protein